VGLKSRRVAAGAVLAVAVAALGCGGATSSAPPSASSASGDRAAAAGFTWLRDKAEPWNHALNADQRTIDAAGAAGNVSGTAYFAQLGSGCSKMLGDAQKARTIERAPSPGLDQAWRAMLAGTETYASDCLTLVRTHADRDLTTWNNSLTAMNAVAGAWNAVVTATRNGAHPSSG
jgi:hypothetical protein